MHVCKKQIHQDVKWWTGVVWIIVLFGLYPQVLYPQYCFLQWKSYLNQEKNMHRSSKKIFNNNIWMDFDMRGQLGMDVFTGLLLVDYYYVFISRIYTHSDGTHSLQRIHCWTSDPMLNFSNSSTCWMTDFHFGVNYSFQVFILHDSPSSYLHHNAFL